MSTLYLLLCEDESGALISQSLDRTTDSALRLITELPPHGVENWSIAKLYRCEEIGKAKPGDRTFTPTVRDE